MTLAAGVGAVVTTGPDKAGFDGTFRILGRGGTGGTEPFKEDDDIEFGGAPTGRRIVTGWVGFSSRPLPVDWVAAPRGPEGLSIASRRSIGDGFSRR